MWMKIIGVMLVMISCTGLGAEAARQLKERRKLLETLKRMVSQLKGEILYSNLPLPTAFYEPVRGAAGLPLRFFFLLRSEWRRPGEKALRRYGIRKQTFFLNTER